MKNESERVKALLSKEEQTAQEKAYEDRKKGRANLSNEQLKELKYEPDFMVYTLAEVELPAKLVEKVNPIELIEIEDDPVPVNTSATAQPVPLAQRTSDKQPPNFLVQMERVLSGEEDAMNVAAAVLASKFADPLIPSPIRMGGKRQGEEQADASKRIKDMASGNQFSPSPTPGDQDNIQNNTTSPLGVADGSSHDGTPTSVDSVLSNPQGVVVDPQPPAQEVGDSQAPSFYGGRSNIVFESQETMEKLVKDNKNLVDSPAFGKYKLFPQEEFFKYCNKTNDEGKPCFVTDTPTKDWRNMSWISEQMFRYQGMTTPKKAMDIQVSSLIGRLPRDFLIEMNTMYDNWGSSGASPAHLIIFSRVCTYGDGKQRKWGLQIWVQDPVTKEVHIPAGDMHKSATKASAIINVLLIKDIDSEDFWYMEMKPTTEMALEASLVTNGV